MTRTPEGDEKKWIKEWMDARGIYHFWPVQMGMGAAALDCYASYAGKFVAIEVKKEGWVPSDFTDRQLALMQQIRDAGGFVAFGTGNQVIAQLIVWEQDVLPKPKRRNRVGVF